MQYVLTKEEYDAIHTSYKNQLEEKNKIVQELCIDVCKYKPIEGWWNKEGKPSPRPWCILDEERRGYCDSCPIGDKCPYPYKEWSK